jgi:hypothetical protein
LIQEIGGEHCVSAIDSVALAYARASDTFSSSLGYFQSSAKADCVEVLFVKSHWLGPVELWQTLNSSIPDPKKYLKKDYWTCRSGWSSFDIYVERFSRLRLAREIE